MDETTDKPIMPTSTVIDAKIFIENLEAGLDGAVNDFSDPYFQRYGAMGRNLTREEEEGRRKFCEIMAEAEDAAKADEK